MYTPPNGSCSPPGPGESAPPVAETVATYGQNRPSHRLFARCWPRGGVSVDERHPQSRRRGPKFHWHYLRSHATAPRSRSGPRRPPLTPEAVILTMRPGLSGLGNMQLLYGNVPAPGDGGAAPTARAHPQRLGSAFSPLWCPNRREASDISLPANRSLRGQPGDPGGPCAPFRAASLRPTRSLPSQPSTVWA